MTTATVFLDTTQLKVAAVVTSGGNGKLTILYEGENREYSFSLLLANDQPLVGNLNNEAVKLIAEKTTSFVLYQIQNKLITTYSIDLEGLDIEDITEELAEKNSHKNNDKEIHISGTVEYEERENGAREKELQNISTTLHQLLNPDFPLLSTSSTNENMAVPAPLPLTTTPSISPVPEDIIETSSPDVTVPAPPPIEIPPAPQKILPLPTAEKSNNNSAKATAKKIKMRLTFVSNSPQVPAFPKAHIAQTIETKKTTIPEKESPSNLAPNSILFMLKENELLDEETIGLILQCKEKVSAEDSAKALAELIKNAFYIKFLEKEIAQCKFAMLPIGAEADFEINRQLKLSAKEREQSSELHDLKETQNKTKCQIQRDIQKATKNGKTDENAFEHEALKAILSLSYFKQGGATHKLACGSRFIDWCGGLTKTFSDLLNKKEEDQTKLREEVLEFLSIFLQTVNKFCKWENGVVKTRKISDDGESGSSLISVLEQTADLVIFLMRKKDRIDRKYRT